MKSKSSRAVHAVKRTRHFSLVSAEAQQEMYRALCALHATAVASLIDSGAPSEPVFGSLGWSGAPGEPVFRSVGQSGAEIAEIAACIAAGASCPVVLACPASGARIIADDRRVISDKGRRLTSSTLAAMDALLTRSLNGSANDDSLVDAAGSETSPAKNARRRSERKKQSSHPCEDAAIVCAGLLEAEAEAKRDYRAAFRFAARHKLPILYVIANQLTTSPEKAALDLRSIYPEFGIPLFTVDANDVIAAYRVATEALHNARHLRGPSVIEALAVPLHGISSETPLQLLTAYMKRHGNAPR